MPPETETVINKKINIIIIVVIIVLLIIGGYFVYKKYWPTPSEPVREETVSLGGQIYEQVQNPAEKIPETNPYSAKTNPFEEAKINPFENVYKNPF